MFGKKRRSKLGPITDEEQTIDGGEGRGIPLGGRDDRPPTGYNYSGDLNSDDVEHLWEDGVPSDRRRDPLRGR